MGHSVLSTPPRYTDLLSIDLFWACIKSSFAINYCNTTTFNDVQTKLKEEFEFLSSEKGSNTVPAWIDHVDQVIANLLPEIERNKPGVDV